MDKIYKKTIVYIGGFELPDKNAAAHRVLANAKAFRDLGYEVILVGVTKKIDEVSNKFYDVQGFKSYNVKYPASSVEWIAYLSSIKEIKSTLEKVKADFIIAYNYPALPLFKLLKFSRKKNIKILGDVTEWYEVQGNLLFKILKTLDVNFRMKNVQNRLDGLIVISDFLQNHYLNNKVVNILNVPPLVDLLDEKWKKKTELISNHTSEFKFIYSGSPGNGNKDRLDIVVESLKKHYLKGSISIIFNIVGISRQEYVTNFNNDKELDSDYDFVKFNGRISHLDSIELLKQADFSIFFRENNLTNIAGFPTKFAESISAGTPVITNVSSSLEKYFSNNEFAGFLIQHLNATEIDEVFEKVFSTDRSIINNYKQSCFDSQIFDYRRYNDEFKKFIETSAI